MTLGTRPRWVLALEEEAAELRQIAQGRRTFGMADTVADALDVVAGRLETRLRALQEPTRLLTCEEWGAEQEPSVSGKTVRRWCQRGELDHDETPSGIRIPVGAVRRPREAPEPVEHPATPAPSPALSPSLAVAS